MELNGNGKKSSWIDHPGTVTVVATVAGSIIIVVGQLFGTLFPIWFGPDLSDYDLVCDPVYHRILFTYDNSSFGSGSVIITPGFEGYSNNTITIPVPRSTTNSYSYYTTSTISVNSLHRYYKYDREIYLNIESPPGINVSLSDPVIRRGKSVDLDIDVDILTLLKSRHLMYGTAGNFKYPLTIQGVGADGKKRNCTVIISMGPADTNSFARLFAGWA